MVADFERPNPTGRSSGKYHGARKKLNVPPKGEAWAWLPAELIRSPAWRLRSINCVRFIDFLLVEHMQHAGTENGNLKATFRQLEEWGLSGNLIASAIREAEFAGLVKTVQKGGWIPPGVLKPSTYRLTFYSDGDGTPKTNRWKAITKDDIKAWRAKERAKRGAQKNSFPPPKVRA